MIRHIVLFRFISDDPALRAEQLAEVGRRSRALVGVIPGLLALDVHANCLDDPRNSDFALVGDFEDLASVEAYVPHPAHRELIAYLSTVRIEGSRTAIDYEL
ncbi:Dabb family protein [Leucobacter massiliensis]|uniref:Stress-response A/B barrel domain-containing protein n=1 Tax=Leucobacter massiliensis TaxID=1686285 RepID=A0A2S9QNL0_9MICO|nr:Dabb family protein [Leucobacter massiliensis]PRI11167.1 hypothetical protein B4915_09950 [Leucobacter massiliensis]